MTLPSDDYRSQGARRKLVQELRNKGIIASQVLEAIGQVPRHLFFEDTALRLHAYEDKPFPIGCGQTISQPFTVATQTQLLEVRRGDRVLEVGTGSGYQTAVLAAMGAKVWSIERHRPLFLSTRTRLESMGYKASLYHGDGFQGLPTYAPYDRILVTCGAPFVPEPLVEQLRLGGSLVIPVGEGPVQRMVRIRRLEDNTLSREEHGDFRFVPMLADRQ
ncbi:MAG: protein-L-isoaspartate(D-aspartate) O-methyltransferase [Flavobacteriales bacterium]|nr:protein-L-isoaspartate(D-aspartate) O-methyltransferase [Flavobacteriales bacterium]MBK8947663.1 protein-L-isoaspartate(D-aspartate) O-methyltransferase [Flavobacteriales bacterium]MBK9700398.1 protein-L-isoaspartate(D-aspartate) O-methyltransferase [Flavobacteriales bacterium]